MLRPSQDEHATELAFGYELQLCTNSRRGYDMTNIVRDAIEALKELPEDRQETVAASYPGLCRTG